jgi:transposase, IS30 family
MGHLTSEQRYTISVLLKSQMKPSDIAKHIDKDKSVVSREVRRNCDQRSGEYRYELAQKKCEARHAEKRKNVRFTVKIQNQVIRKLTDNYSPEQIVGRLKAEGADCVSHEAIYQFIWENKSTGGNLYKHLRNKGKRYRKRGSAKDARGIIPNRTDIDQRPEVVEHKKRFGDFETDTIIGENHKKALLTINDRATGYGIIRKLESKEACLVAEKMIKALMPFSEYTHTITSDNGLEFARHEKVAEKLSLDFYFAKPYHSWERGSNENYNRLVRQYFPKGTNFNQVTIGDIRKVQNALNNRPRKRFGYLTPNEMLENLNIFDKVAFIT